MLHHAERRQRATRLRTQRGPSFIPSGYDKMSQIRLLQAERVYLTSRARSQNFTEESELKKMFTSYPQSRAKRKPCTFLLACWLLADFVLYCSGSPEEGKMLQTGFWLFPHQLNARECHKDMLIGQTDPDNPS